MMEDITYVAFRGTKDKLQVSGRVAEGYFGISISVYLRRWCGTRELGYNIVFPETLIYRANTKYQSIIFSDLQEGDELLVNGGVAGTVYYGTNADGDPRWDIESKE